MCIPLASCYELCHFLNCYRSFTVCREEPWAWWRGILGQEDKALCWCLGCAFHKLHDHGQDLPPDLQSQHLKRRDSDTCATHLAGCYEKQIKYLKSASQTVQIYLRNSYEITKPIHSLWVQICSLLFYFSHQSLKTSPTLVIRKHSSLFIIHPAPLPICRLSQNRRVKFKSSICS